MQYTTKINSNGEYRKFHGWSVISMLKDDLKFIENYIKLHPVLSSFFSALPSESYHMTEYNIWCGGKKLLAHQERFIQQNIEHKHWSHVIEQSNRHEQFFNPNGCMNSLLYKLHYECSTCNFEKNKFKIKAVKYNGNTIRLSFNHENDGFRKMDKFRNKLINVCEEDDFMGSYHVTLGYKYRDSSTTHNETIAEQVEILNTLLIGQTVTLNNPFVCCFENMTAFKSFTHSI